MATRLGEEPYSSRLNMTKIWSKRVHSSAGQMAIGTSRSDDATAARTLHVHHFFYTFSFLFYLHDYVGKMPNLTFYGGRKQETTKFHFSL